MIHSGVARGTASVWAAESTVATTIPTPANAARTPQGGIHSEIVPDAAAQPAEPVPSARRSASTLISAPISTM